MVGYRRLRLGVAEVADDFWEGRAAGVASPGASMRILPQPGGSAEAVEELLGAGAVGLALELCPHVAGPLEEQRGLGCAAGGGARGTDAFR